MERQLLNTAQGLVGDGRDIAQRVASSAQRMLGQLRTTAPTRDLSHLLALRRVVSQTQHAQELLRALKAKAADLVAKRVRLEGQASQARKDLLAEAASAQLQHLEARKRAASESSEGSEAEGHGLLEMAAAAVEGNEDVKILRLRVHLLHDHIHRITSQLASLAAHGVPELLHNPQAGITALHEPHTPAEAQTAHLALLRSMYARRLLPESLLYPPAPDAPDALPLAPPLTPAVHPPPPASPRATPPRPRPPAATAALSPASPLRTARTPETPRAAEAEAEDEEDEAARAPEEPWAVYRRELRASLARCVEHTAWLRPHDLGEMAARVVLDRRLGDYEQVKLLGCIHRKVLMVRQQRFLYILREVAVGADPSSLVRSQIIRELHQIRALRHRNLCLPDGVLFDGVTAYVRSPFCSEATLVDLMVRLSQARRQHLPQCSPLSADSHPAEGPPLPCDYMPPERCVKRVLQHVLRALVFLHTRGLAHGALTPQAVILDRHGTALLTGGVLSALKTALTDDCTSSCTRYPEGIAPPEHASALAASLVSPQRPVHRGAAQPAPSPPLQVARVDPLPLHVQCCVDEVPSPRESISSPRANMHTYAHPHARTPSSSFASPTRPQPGSPRGSLQLAHANTHPHLSAKPSPPKDDGPPLSPSAGAPRPRSTFPTSHPYRDRWLLRNDAQFKGQHAARGDAESTLCETAAGCLAELQPDLADWDHRLSLDASADMWSLGVLLYQLHFPGTPVFIEPDEEDAAQESDAFEGCAVYLPPHPDPFLRSLLASLLQRDPTARPSAQQALAHPFLTGCNETRSPGSHPCFPISSPPPAPAHSPAPPARPPQSPRPRTRSMSAAGSPSLSPHSAALPSLPSASPLSPSLPDALSAQLHVSRGEGRLSPTEPPWSPSPLLLESLDSTITAEAPDHAAITAEDASPRARPPAAVPRRRLVSAQPALRSRPSLARPRSRTPTPDEEGATPRAARILRRGHSASAARPCDSRQPESDAATELYRCCYPLDERVACAFTELAAMRDSIDSSDAPFVVTVDLDDVVASTLACFEQAGPEDMHRPIVVQFQFPSLTASLQAAIHAVPVPVPAPLSLASLAASPRSGAPTTAAPHTDVSLPSPPPSLPTGGEYRADCKGDEHRTVDGDSTNEHSPAAPSPSSPSQSPASPSSSPRPLRLSTSPQPPILASPPPCISGASATWRLFALFFEQLRADLQDAVDRCSPVALHRAGHLGSGGPRAKGLAEDLLETAQNEEHLLPGKLRFFLPCSKGRSSLHHAFGRVLARALIEGVPLPAYLAPSLFSFLLGHTIPTLRSLAAFAPSLALTFRHRLASSPSMASTQSLDAALNSAGAKSAEFSQRDFILHKATDLLYGARRPALDAIKVGFEEHGLVSLFERLALTTADLTLVAAGQSFLPEVPRGSAEWPHILRFADFASPSLQESFLAGLSALSDAVLRRFFLFATYEACPRELCAAAPFVDDSGALMAPEGIAVYASHDIDAPQAHPCVSALDLPCPIGDEQPAQAHRGAKRAPGPAEGAEAEARDLYVPSERLMVGIVRAMSSMDDLDL